MIYLSDFKEVESGKFLVGYKHFYPFDEKIGLGKTIDELEEDGLLVDSLPEFPKKLAENERATLFLGANNMLFYEVETKSFEELEDDERFNLLKKENKELKLQMQLTQEALDVIIMGGM